MNPVLGQHHGIGLRLDRVNLLKVWQRTDQQRLAKQLPVFEQVRKALCVGLTEMADQQRLRAVSDLIRILTTTLEEQYL